MAFRWTVSCLVLTVGAAGATSRLANARCHASCARLVDSKEQAATCNACLTSDAPAAWVFKARALPAAAQADADWAVRWASLVRERGSEAAAAQALRARVSKQPAERTRTCETLAHAMGAFDGGPQPLPAECLTPAREALATALLATEPWERREALLHGPGALGVSPGRFVLDAVRGRAPTATQIAWGVLADADRGHEGPTPAALVGAAAGAGDEPAMNAFLALAAQALDARRAALAGEDAPRRREALLELTPFAPWIGPALEEQLLRPGLNEARVAAAALARGAGASFVDYAQARIAAPTTPPQVRSVWLALLGSVGRAGCEQALRPLALDAARTDDVRREALAALAACARADALDVLEQAARERSVVIRAAAIEAAGNVPRSARATELVNAALDDPEPSIQRAALRAANAVGLPPTRFAALTRSADDGVRAAALAALFAARPSEATPLVCACLEREASADVRLVCAEQLGASGRPTPQVQAALAKAAETDAEPRVKMAAAAALRRLRVR